MKNTHGFRASIALAAVSALVLNSACVHADKPTKGKGSTHLNTGAKPAGKTAVFSVSKMHCEGCASGLTQAAGKWHGVKSADVSFVQKRAIVTYNPKQTDPAKISKEFARVGFPAKAVR